MTGVDYFLNLVAFCSRPLHLPLEILTLIHDHLRRTPLLHCAACAACVLSESHDRLLSMERTYTVVDGDPVCMACVRSP